MRLYSQLYRPVDYSSPPGETPENVLNPLSIYALTRQNIDDKESVDYRNSLYSTRVADTFQTPRVLTNSDRQRGQDSSSAAPQPQPEFGPSASRAQYNTASDEFMPNMALMWEQHDLGAGMDQFWPGLMSDFDALWLPAETTQENMSAMDMPTWVPRVSSEIIGTGFVIRDSPRN